MKAALFDLDGTLFDSSRGGDSEGVLEESYRAALEGFLPIPPASEVLRLVGQPVRAIFAGLYPDVPEAKREEGARRVLATLCERIRGGGGRLLPGAHDALAGLARRGVRRGIITNARRPYLDAVLAGHGLAPLVETAVCDGDRPGYGKGAWIVEILSGWEISPLDAVFVGDRRNDLEGAREAGVRFLGVAGHGDAAELAGADAILSRVDEILDRV